MVSVPFFAVPSLEDSMNDLNTANDARALVTAMGLAAREASRVVARADTAAKNRALEVAADSLVDREKTILAANAKDVKAARAEGADDAFIDRLKLTAKMIEEIAQGLRQVAGLPDPVGEITDLRYRPSGIQVGRMRVPLGVVGIIYESRPDVTADAGALCLKSGNAAILRGGSESLHSNQAIAACLHAGLKAAGLPETALQLVGTTDRAAVGELIAAEKYVDVIVPRGGKGLVERISKEARVPVIKHLDGVCHVYVDEGADPAKALAIVENAKTQRYGTCNTMETLLLAQAIAPGVLPAIGKMFEAKGVEMRACPESKAILEKAGVQGVKEATDDDWYAEYLAPIVAITTVPGLDEAIAHIAQATARSTRMPSSPRTGGARSASSARSIRLPSW